MKPIIKEKHRDTPGVISKFVRLSKIKNNRRRRVALIASFPCFFSFNCLAVLPVIGAAFLLNNMEMIMTIAKYWDHPAQEKN